MSELKAINALGIRKDDGAYYDRSQVDKYIDELDERHTAEITALEVSYRLQLDGLRYDKDAEIRRLKRALWIARAERAADRARIFYFCDLEEKLDIEGFSYDYKKKKGYKKVPARLWRIIWLKVERKCREKAEEYK